jgi:hypothetical protein
MKCEPQIKNVEKHPSIQENQVEKIKSKQNKNCLPVWYGEHLFTEVFDGQP